MEKENLFYCYSAKLRRFIRDNGIKWCESGVNNSHPFWVFKRSTALDRIIEEYKRVN